MNILLQNSAFHLTSYDYAALIAIACVALVIITNHKNRF